MAKRVQNRRRSSLETELAEARAAANASTQAARDWVIADAKVEMATRVQKLETELAEARAAANASTQAARDWVIADAKVEMATRVQKLETELAEARAAANASMLRCFDAGKRGARCKRAAQLFCALLTLMLLLLTATPVKEQQLAGAENVPPATRSPAAAALALPANASKSVGSERSSRGLASSATTAVGLCWRAAPHVPAVPQSARAAHDHDGAAGAQDDQPRPVQVDGYRELESGR